MERAPQLCAALVASLALLTPAGALGVSVEGVVLDSAGEPLQGVVVYAYDLRLGYAYDATDSEGVYRIQGLEPGRYRLRAVPGYQLRQVARAWPDERAFCDGELLLLDSDAAELGFALPEGGSLQGVLLDHEGLPVEGATVSASGADDTTAGLVRLATSASDGGFELLGLDAPAGESSLWRCEVELGGWPDQFLEGVYDDEEADLVELAEGEAQDLGTWTLQPGVGAAGVILGPDGPVEGASVHVYAESQVVSVASQEDGSFEAWAVPPGQMLIWSSADGLGTTYWPASDRPEASLEVGPEGAFEDGFELTMPAQATLVGRLAAQGDLSSVTVLLYNDTKTVGRGALVEEDGSFVIDRLHGGDYQLFVYASDEGYLDDWVRDASGEPRWFALEGEQDNVVDDIPLPEGATLAGVVLDEQGEPIHGAYVYAREREGELVEVAATDREGGYRIPGLVEGGWSLEVRYLHYCSADPGYVTSYWEGQVYEARAAAIDLEPGDLRDGLDFTLPQDDDHDQMGDRWEDEVGLDSSRDDAAEDPDGDGYSNLDEYHLGTDPLAVYDDGRGRCGCGGGAGGFGALLLALPLGLRRRYARRSTHSA
jgi:hypothetical protein